MGKRQAGVVLVAGILLVAPAAVAAISPFSSATSSTRLASVSRAIADKGPQAADDGLAARWRIADDGVREVSLGFPSSTATVPFNLFAQPDLIPGYEATGPVAGMGANPVIVPGDYGATTLRVSNNGTMAGKLSVKLQNASLKQSGDQQAYQHLLINGQPAAKLLRHSTTQLNLATMPQLAVLLDDDGRVTLQPGQQVDLPFTWSYFADPTDPLTGRQHSIGNFAATQAQFQLDLQLTGDDDPELLLTGGGDPLAQALGELALRPLSLFLLVLMLIALLRYAKRRGWLNLRTHAQQ